MRRLLFSNLWLTLSAVLGVMQVVIGHWVTVVLAGRAGPGLGLGLLLAATLIAANLYILPIVRRARLAGGWQRRLAGAYVGFGVATLLLGLAVTVSWAGLFPLASLLELAGVTPPLAFELFRYASVLVVGAMACALLWGFTGGQSRIERTQIEIPLDGLDPLHRGLRIVQLSDLHIGNGMEGERLERLVAEVNAMRPDVVALTGDLFDFDPAHVEGGAKRLGALQARLGVFAVLGNHDTYTGIEQVVEALGRLAPGLELLRGEVVALGVEPPLYLAGVDDPGRDWTANRVHIEQLEQLGGRLPGDGPVILLVHRPEAFPQAARLGFPLVLAGHTHGGQLAVPLPGGRINLARLVTRFHRGLYVENDSVLYVNRGVGIAGPALRVGCRREIATIVLA